jgi:luciferase family oxidoreductase group 1
MPVYSLLDLSPIVVGATPSEALRNSLDMARHAERLGYKRVWVAEHHNMTGIASSATSVLIGYLAGGTSRVRVGSGGIMLPNHAPLVIAEQFGTLDALYPGRIDLGVGRAPGGDPATAARCAEPRQQRRHVPADLAELQSLLPVRRDAAARRAVPGQGSNVPIWPTGLERLQRDACRRTRAAVRVRVATSRRIF